LIVAPFALQAASARAGLTVGRPSAEKPAMNPFASKVLIVCAVVIGLAVCSASAATAAPSGDQPKGSLLYVQQTSGGSIERLGHGVYRLRLTGISPRVSTFTDRPRRRAGSQGIEGFVHKWRANGFAADPPNAALVLDQAPASRDVALLTLSHPHYNRAKQTLTYRATPLHGREPALASFARRADPISAGELGGASLFVDDGGGGGRVTITFDFENTVLTTTTSQILISGPASFCLAQTAALTFSGTISFTSLFMTRDALDFNVESGTTFNAAVVVPVESEGAGSPSVEVTNFTGTVTVTWPTDTGFQTQTVLAGDPLTLVGLAS
jgi:hypothetical protein